MIDIDIQTTLSFEVNQTQRHCRDFFFLFPTKSYVFKLFQHLTQYLNSDTIIQSYTHVYNPAAATAAQRSDVMLQKLRFAQPAEATPMRVSGCDIKFGAVQQGLSTELKSTVNRQDPKCEQSEKS